MRTTTVVRTTGRAPLDELEARADRAFADFRLKVAVMRSIGVDRGLKRIGISAVAGRAYDSLRESKVTLFAALDALPPTTRARREDEAVECLAMESLGYVPAAEACADCGPDREVA